MESKVQKKIAPPITKEILEWEILIRLPVKSLIRFKSVCKSWRSLILSRSFIDLHRVHHCHDYSNQLHLSPYISTSSSTLTTALTDVNKLVRRQIYPALRSEIARQRERGSFRLLGPLSNGIYCMIGNSSAIALCNPATKDYKLTNPFPSQLKTLISAGARVHYGFGSVLEDGFGFDYRVVVVVNQGLQNSSFVSFVYSMQRGTWRKNVDYECWRGRYPEIIQDLEEVCPQKLFKGCWHWMAWGPKYNCSLLSFNLGDDSFRLIGGPNNKGYCGSKTVKKGGVLVLNDHLAVIYILSPQLPHVHLMILMFG